MPQQVVWNLSYPTETSEQQTRFRHHVEVLSRDAHVAQVEASERPDVPYRMTLRIRFVEGFERPDSQELRFADVCYPQDARVERDIRVGPPPADLVAEQAEAIMHQLGAAMEVIGAAGTTITQAFNHFAEALSAIPVPTFTLPSIPSWIHAGTAYIAKHPRAGTAPFHRVGDIAIVQNIRAHPEFGVSVEVAGQGGSSIIYDLAEFVHCFEPSEPGDLFCHKHPTAWDKVLENSDVDDD